MQEERDAQAEKLQVSCLLFGGAETRSTFCLLTYPVTGQGQGRGGGVGLRPCAGEQQSAEDSEQRRARDSRRGASADLPAHPRSLHPGPRGGAERLKSAPAPQFGHLPACRGKAKILFCSIYGLILTVCSNLAHR